jgi:hypothetical protein
LKIEILLIPLLVTSYHIFEISEEVPRYSHGTIHGEREREGERGREREREIFI